MIDLTTLNPLQKKLRRLVLEISHHHKWNHLGSCLTVVDLIEAIYQVKNSDDLIVLSNGHAAVGWYAVLVERGLVSLDEAKTFPMHTTAGFHPDISVSTGSLGQGLPIAVGLALADRSRKVFCLISDGEGTEGSIMESLRVIINQNLVNLKLIVNANGWANFAQVDPDFYLQVLAAMGFEVLVEDQMKIENYQEALAQVINENQVPNALLALTDSDQLPFALGQDAHHHVMSDQEYQEGMKALEIEQ